MRIFKYFTINLVWIWLGLFALLPLVLIFITSFLTQDVNHFVKLPITLHNYLQLFSSSYILIFFRSLYFSISCTLMCLLLGYPFAFIIAKSKLKHKTLLLLLIIIPFWTSSLIRTFAIMTVLKTKGILNTILLTLGIIHHPLHILYSYLAVLIGAVYDLLPFMILPLYANIEKLNETFLEAARDLGAGKITIFLRVLLPLTLPGIIAGTLLVFLPAMTMFYIPVLLGGAKDMLLGNLIQDQFLIFNNWPRGAAISVFVVVLLCVFIYIYWRKTKFKEVSL